MLHIRVIAPPRLTEQVSDLCGASIAVTSSGVAAPPAIGA
jgi:hypothetical protein